MAHVNTYTIWTKTAVSERGPGLGRWELLYVTQIQLVGPALHVGFGARATDSASKRNKDITLGTAFWFPYLIFAKVASHMKDEN